MFVIILILLVVVLTVTFTVFMYGTTSEEPSEEPITEYVTVPKICLPANATLQQTVTCASAVNRGFLLAADTDDVLKVKMADDIEVSIVIGVAMSDGAPGEKIQMAIGGEFDIWISKPYSLGTDPVIGKFVQISTRLGPGPIETELGDTKVIDSVAVTVVEPSAALATQGDFIRARFISHLERV